MYRGEEDFDYHYWDAEKLIKLFSSIKPPRIPYIFPKKKIDYKEGIEYGTKDVIINEWVKRVKPGEPVDGKYMFDAVSKMCYGYPPCETLSPLVIKLSRCGHADTALDLVYLVRREGGGNPSFVAMNALLNGLGRAKKVDKMKRLLHDMFEEDFCFSYDLSSFLIIYVDCKELTKRWRYLIGWKRWRTIHSNHMI
ncbi:hypothetical protein FRX31_034848 [Thalictrum thalictroides]|uniref:Pentatricopeptide repeat-containing protein n=1 Tax=Thalictrum thalictroides TaxID=46969 RepID=A0A7J6UTT3_THATH|nr:hypothetical protein FRX31_034848 [Thalictrum thalictroides]